MGQDDWFRNSIWNKKISDLFETKLKRARGSASKAQYLRIQASYLLNSINWESQQVGLQLMERLLKDFPTEEFSTIMAKEQLGDFFVKRGDFLKAQNYFQDVTEHYQRKNRSGTTGIADIKYVETVLKLGQIDRFEKSYTLLTKGFQESGGSLSLNDDRFYYNLVLAELCDKLGKPVEAVQYADKALEIAKIDAPQFVRHRTVGLVRADKGTIDKLLKIKAG